MRRFRVHLALLVVIVAIVGAALHPLAIMLALAPFNTRAVVGFLVELRSVIADLLGWGLLSLLVIMLVYVVVADESASGGRDYGIQRRRGYRSGGP
jgi:hypothetical protein